MAQFAFHIVSGHYTFLQVEPGLGYNLKHRPSGSILIVLRGGGTLDDRELNRGKVFFVGANEVHTIKVPPSACETLLLFQAFVNI